MEDADSKNATPAKISIQIRVNGTRHQHNFQNIFNMDFRMLKIDLYI